MIDWLGRMGDKIAAMPTEEIVWLSIGFGGQALFAMRFIIQWIVSEQKRDSVIPIAFWYFSIGGGAVLLSYAIWREDPVIILGQCTGLFIYLRNLYFIYANRRSDLEVPNPDGAGMAGDPARPASAAARSEEGFEETAQADPGPPDARPQPRR
jgi:lipid-A-disaccharide synthase-like uncharacterized protein